jgi:hypothetical protein
MSQIDFEIRSNDLVAFNEHLMAENGTTMKRLRRHQAMIPGAITIIALMFWFVYQDIRSTIIAGSAAVLWGLAVPAWMQYTMRKQIMGFYSDDDLKNVLGPCRLRVDHNALVEIRGSHESRMNWNDVLRMEITRKYVYIFTDLDAALIIPRRGIKMQDLKDFVGAVDERISAHNS